MEAKRTIIIEYDYKDKKDYVEMIDRLTIQKKVGYKQYIELTPSDRILLDRMRKALVAFDDVKNTKL